MNVFLLLGRILFGGMFLINGINHFAMLQGMTQYAASRGVPAPHALVIISGLMIILGGVSVILGLAPRIGLWLIVAFLVPVTLAMHPFWSISDPTQHMVQMVNFIKNVGLLGAAFGLMAVPVPWRYSVDEPLGKRWPKWPTVSGLQPPLHGV
jgi:putative oxidoreductase